MAAMTVARGWVLIRIKLDRDWVKQQKPAKAKTPQSSRNEAFATGDHISREEQKRCTELVDWYR
jgi:hypothetical protein